MPLFKDRAEIFRQRVEAFHTFFAREFDEVEDKMLDKEIPTLEKELALFLSSVRSMRENLEKELKELKKMATSTEDHESLIPLKEISVIQTNFIFRYYNGYVKRVNAQIDLFNEKVATLLEYYFNQKLDCKEDWTSIKKGLDSEFPFFLKTIYEDYEQVYILRDVFLQDVVIANKKYNHHLDLAGQITVVEDLKNIVNILRKQRACFIDVYKKDEYEKRIHEHQENIKKFEKEITDILTAIARNEHITISAMCINEKKDHLEKMLSTYCDLQEKIKFDEIAIKAEIEALKIEYPYLSLEMPIFPNLTMDSSEIQKRYENALKKGWKNAIANDLDAAYDGLRRGPIVTKKPHDTIDKNIYEERFKQKIETLERKDAIIQILNNMWKKLPWSGYWEKYEKAKRVRHFHQESAELNQMDLDCRESFEQFFPKTFAKPSVPYFVLEPRPMLEEESKEPSYLPRERQTCQRKPVPPYQYNPLPKPSTFDTCQSEEEKKESHVLSDEGQKCQRKPVPPCQPTPLPSPPTLSTCHLMLSCLCFGIGGLIYLGFYAYQYYQYRKSYNQNCFFRKKLKQEEMPQPHKDLICQT